MYELRILPRSQKELEALPEKQYQLMLDALRKLTEQPRPIGCKKLSDRIGWRIRVGDYRAIFLIDDTRKVITVLNIGNRKDVYR